jgi:hypothetical protein
MPSLSLLVGGVVLSVAAVLGSRLGAQEVQLLPVEKSVAPAPAPAPPRFDVAPTLAALTQATRAKAAPERAGDAAWVLLALVANGSTMTRGTYRADVRSEIRWLIEFQDPDAGGFVVRAVPCTRGEQLLGALALNEAYAGSNYYRPYQRNAERSISASAAHLLSPQPAPATFDEFVLAMLLARYAAKSKRDPAVVEQLGKVVEHARSTMPADKGRRTDAALHLDELLQGKVLPPELTIARAWPANLTADPLHTLIGALAVSVSPMPEKVRVAQFETLAALVAARATEGEHAGTWAPAGSFDRITTTAMHAITLALANGSTPLFFAK